MQQLMYTWLVSAQQGRKLWRKNISLDQLQDRWPFQIMMFNLASEVNHQRILFLDVYSSFGFSQTLSFQVRLFVIIAQRI